MQLISDAKIIVTLGSDTESLYRHNLGFPEVVEKDLSQFIKILDWDEVRGIESFCEKLHSWDRHYELGNPGHPDTEWIYSIKLGELISIETWENFKDDGYQRINEISLRRA